MYDFLFTGDCFLNSNTTDESGKEPFTASVEKLFANSHNICINLETTVGNGGKKVAKAYNFQISPEMLNYLIDNNIQICSLANNHSNDYGEEGLKETIRNLESRNISHIGTEKNNLIIQEVNGQKIAICSYFSRQKGLARLDVTEISDDIKRYKKCVGIVVVCLHWGEEYVAYPSPHQQQIAHVLVEAGANVIIGHHPHVIQGCEEYKNGIIFYSLGNFNFFVDHPYAKTMVETTKGYCVGLKVLESGAIKYEIVPIHINAKWQPNVISDNAGLKRFFSYFDSISAPLRKNIGSGFWYSEAAPHYFHNHLPSWKKRVREFGIMQVFQMIKWLVHPSIYKFYIGMTSSLFHKKIRY